MSIVREKVFDLVPIDSMTGLVDIVLYNEITRHVLPQNESLIAGSALGS